MRIAIVHYHLRSGGVTRVIENAVAALERKGIEPVVLSGEPYKGSSLNRSITVEGLNYTDSFADSDTTSLTDHLLMKASEGLGGPPDVWHFHNHSLGKNPNLPEAVFRLASRNQRILLQIHDFPEDGRPTNFSNLAAAFRGRKNTLEEVLYPIAPQVHYAVLNRRDESFLLQSGLPRELLHYLPNPVFVPNSERSPGDRKTKTKADRLILYPTRGIRRKNIGELVLWATMAERGESFATTLAPDNPKWLPFHDRWHRVAQSLKLPLELGVIPSSVRSFEDWIAEADALITTSVVEGFGLAFLEAGLFRKPLLGRNLPEITEDFRCFGINLPSLYDQLLVPIDLVGERSLRRRLNAALENAYTAYQIKLPPDAVDSALQANTSDQHIDFGFLDEPLQEKVILKLAVSESLRKSVRPNRLAVENGQEVIKRYRDQVLKHFSLNQYGGNLENIYARVADSESAPLDSLPSHRLLSCFLDPKRFRLLQC